MGTLLPTLDGMVRVMGNADGSYGTSLGELDRPAGIAYAEGNLFVADYGNQRVVKMASDGTVTELVDTSGITTYSYPYGLHCGPSGDVYVGLSPSASTTTPNSEVRRYTAAGSLVSTTEFTDHVCGIVTNPDEDEVWCHVTSQWGESTARRERQVWQAESAARASMTVLQSNSSAGSFGNVARDDTYAYFSGNDNTFDDLYSYDFATKTKTTTTDEGDASLATFGGFILDGVKYQPASGSVYGEEVGSGGFTDSGTKNTVWSLSGFTGVNGMCHDGAGGIFVTTGPALTSSSTDGAYLNCVYRLIRQDHHDVRALDFSRAASI